MRRLLLPVLFLALAAPAAADAPWSAPAPVSSIARPSLNHPRALFSRDGAGVVSWGWFDGSREGASYSLRPARGGAFGSERIFAGGREQASAPATYGRGWGAMAWTRTRQTRVEIGRFPTSGFSRTTRQIVGSGRRIVRPVVAANAAGDIAVAWFDDRGTSNDQVLVATRRAGKAFARPVLLATEKVRGVTVAVGARGDVLVAWDAFGKVRTRLRDPNGHGFHARDTIASEDAYSARLRAVLLGNGRAIVGWSAQFRSEGGDQGPALHQVAVRPAGARRFRAAQVLERNGAQLPQDTGLELAVDGRGRPVAAWPGHDGATYRVRVADADARGVFGAPQTISPAGADAALQALAAGPAGEAVVLWDRGDFPDDNRVFAAFRPADGAFGAAESVSIAGRVARPSVAFDPLSARPVAVWEEAGADRAFRVMSATRG